MSDVAFEFITPVGYASAYDTASQRHRSDQRVLAHLTRAITAMIFVPSLLAMLWITALLAGFKP